VQRVEREHLHGVDLVSDLAGAEVGADRAARADELTHLDGPPVGDPDGVQRHRDESAYFMNHLLRPFGGGE
jgi:hypothetical protein